MRYSLARIPLRWMIRECFKANTGIKFNSNSFSRIGLDPSTLYGAMCSRRAPLGVSTSDRIRALFHQGDNANDSEPSGLPFNTEEEEELYDAISRKYDELRINRAWWIPEILPIPQVRMPGRGGIWVEHYWYVYLETNLFFFFLFFFRVLTTHLSIQGRILGDLELFRTKKCIMSRFIEA